MTVAEASRPRTIRHPRENPRAFFEDALAASQRACDAAGGTDDRFYEVAGCTVRLRFAGAALIPLIVPALQHLSVPPSRPALTVWLWDSASTGVSMPPAPWPVEAITPRGDVAGYNDDRIATCFQADASLLSMLDAGSAEAVYWIRDWRHMPAYETAAPLLRIFHWWLQRRGQQVIHSAAVGTASGGVLLAGKSGAGKSTTALTCLDAGLAYLGDDYCVMAPTPEPTIFSLYNSGKTHASDVKRLPFLERQITNRKHLTDEKALYFLHREFPERLMTSVPLRAILLPRISGDKETTARRARPSAGVTSLCPSTISQLPGARRETIEIVAGICRQVPVYHLELGTDKLQIPQVVSSILSGC